MEYLNASECLLTLSEIVTDFHELSVTVSEKTFNSWQDLRSNVLGYIGVDEPLVLLPEIKVFEANYQIRIRCDQPELLPESAEIIGVTGQTSGKFSLEKTSENTIPHTLKPGIYFLIFRTETWSQVVQMAVIR